MHGFLGGANRFAVVVGEGGATLAGQPLPADAVALAPGVADGPAQGFVRAHDLRSCPPAPPAPMPRDGWGIW